MKKLIPNISKMQMGGEPPKKSKNTQVKEGIEFGMNNILPLVNPLGGKGLSTVASRASKVLPKIDNILNFFKSSKPFKSEINWAKWNKEIPNNSELMKEYNAIEKTSKANKSWMKNPDGSAFKGTPEQFIQENSKNFKKAFKESIIRDEKGNIVKMYHGSINKEPLTEYITPKRLENFKRRTQTTKETDHTFFSPKKEIADKYSKRDLLGNDKGIIYENYINVKNPYFTDNYIDVAMPHNLPNINSYDAVTNIKFGKDYFPKDYSELAIPFGNNVKSARGNNGMFDMNNPNIYKALIPAAISTTASTINKKDSKNKLK